MPWHFRRGHAPSRNWDERFRNLFKLATGVFPGRSYIACFKLQQIGEAVPQGHDYLVKVRILSREVLSGQSQEAHPGPQLAVLRARHADWNVVSRGSGPARALWTSAATAICLEEVQVFQSHGLYAQVMALFAECGFRIVWKQVLFLHEVAPTSPSFDDCPSACKRAACRGLCHCHATLA